MTPDPTRATPKSTPSARIVRGVVSAGLLGFLLWRADLSGIVARLAGVHAGSLLAACVLLHVDRMLQAWKWRGLLLSSGTPIRLRDAIANTYMGNFAGQFLPSGVGGDVARVFLLRKMRLPTDEVVASIAMERVVGFCALLATASVAVLVGAFLDAPAPEGLPGGILVVSAIAAAGAVTSLSPRFESITTRLSRPLERFRLRALADSLIRAYRRYAGRKRAVTVYFFLSIVEVAAMTLVTHVACLSLSLEVGLVPLLLIVPVTLVSMRIPVSVNGLGVREGVLVFTLGALGHSAEAALALSVTMRFLDLGVSAIGGLLFWTQRGEQDRPPSQEHPR
jgi:hypothetical protein